MVIIFGGYWESFGMLLHSFWFPKKEGGKGLLTCRLSGILMLVRLNVACMMLLLDPQRVVDGGVLVGCGVLLCC